MSNNESTTDTMADVSHANPYTGETVGRLFSRGPTVATDGGRDATESTERTDDEPTDTMADVDHTPPQDAEDANRVFERGRKHPVEDEE
ncbi:hypothetical protein Htur_2766 [Haloterrigena turkmenica DSM 5511]|uniref:Uncharacterized protein n=1 Tax=Haloterrigena turkmenica (strain ATCC 51198 / DSM 5511 / JCM 9101 / NCIMB 13204 / VKM B-1734 / 4k) TaxID=543526 RepID=D2RXB5_HALTV|nr:hypothetical protein [Haloterrigena turkmenica]ADB61639.1 hypothetical protein Htur_2766 [Haloterrigena turkmenica DSM 5511]